ncbi:MAG: ribosome silencing factor [Gammaproteobacteria bacterium]|nr:ribosome silencing factor [Gammaproteobacteria bacterium]MCY4166257.1 ribosome silencing factor [Gammaproteobacteria bacterium]MCY4254817.1 ribosome silencing factor [Gammaproteobacteria bacterium]MCY4341041.1 ribosome silencing factor [Gammaproteobacteria bacterium]
MSADLLPALAESVLDELQAADVRWLDVRGQTAVTDRMVIATGRNARHIKALADRLVERGKKAGCPVLGVEGLQWCDWVLIDFGDLVIHLMRRETRDFYKLEDLWEFDGAA